MKDKMLKELYNIDNRLENIAIEVIYGDFETKDDEKLKYILTSIETLAKKIRENLK